MRTITQIKLSLATQGITATKEMVTAIMLEKTLLNQHVSDQLWQGILAMGSETASQLLPATWVPQETIWTEADEHTLRLLAKLYPSSFKVSYWESIRGRISLKELMELIPALTKEQLMVDDQFYRPRQNELYVWFSRSPAWEQIKSAHKFSFEASHLLAFHKLGLFPAFTVNELISYLSHHEDYNQKEATNLVLTYLQKINQLPTPTYALPALQEMLKDVAMERYRPPAPMQAYAELFPKDFIQMAATRSAFSETSSYLYILSNTLFKHEFPENLEKAMFNNAIARANLLRNNYAWKYISFKTTHPNAAENIRTVLSQNSDQMDMKPILSSLSPEKWLEVCTITKKTPSSLIRWMIQHAPTTEVRSHVICKALTTGDSFIARDILSTTELSPIELAYANNPEILKWLHEPVFQANASALLQMLEPHGEQSPSEAFTRVYYLVKKPTRNQTLEALSIGVHEVRCSHLKTKELEQLVAFSRISRIQPYVLTKLERALTVRKRTKGRQAATHKKNLKES